MDIREWHYDFKTKLNKIDSLDRPDLLPHQIDWILNEAIEVFIKSRYGISNNKRQGFEVTQKRIDDLKTLVIKCPTPIQPGLPVTLVNTSEGLYEAKLDDLVFDYLYLVRVEAALSKSNCNKTVQLVLTQHDDLSPALRDSFVRPSFEWGEVPAVLARGVNPPLSTNGSIFIYTGNQFTLVNVYPEYIKKPEKVSIGGYVYLDGSVVGTVESDMPEHTHREIIDIAVYLASTNIQIPELINISQSKFLTQE